MMIPDLIKGTDRPVILSDASYEAAVAQYAQSTESPGPTSDYVSAVPQRSIEDYHEKANAVDGASFVPLELGDLSTRAIAVDHELQLSQRNQSRLSQDGSHRPFTSANPAVSMSMASNDKNTLDNMQAYDKCQGRETVDGMECGSLRTALSQESQQHEIRSSGFSCAEQCLPRSAGSGVFGKGLERVGTADDDQHHTNVPSPARCESPGRVLDHPATGGSSVCASTRINETTDEDSAAIESPSVNTAGSNGQFSIARTMHNLQSASVWLVGQLQHFVTRMRRLLGINQQDQHLRRNGAGDLEQGSRWKSDTASIRPPSELKLQQDYEPGVKDYGDSLTAASDKRNSTASRSTIVLPSSQLRLGPGGTEVSSSATDPVSAHGGHHIVPQEDTLLTSGCGNIKSIIWNSLGLERAPGR